MKAVSDLLFPAQSLTPLLVTCSCLTGLIIGVPMAWFWPLKSRISERCGKAFGFGGAWGMAVCLLALVAFTGSENKLPPKELATALVLAFVTSGISALVAQGLATWLTGQERGGRPAQISKVRSLSGRQDCVSRERENFGLPAISTRRR